MDNRTKIICTIGPASQEKSVLHKMIAAGLDCVRLNFSHGTYSQFSQIIRNVREISKELGREIGIMQDLQGPKIRVGEVPAEGVKVKKGETVVLSLNKDAPMSHRGSNTVAESPMQDDMMLRHQPRLGLKEKNAIPVQYRLLAHDVKPGDTLLIDDGLIELHILRINSHKTAITCEVKVGGTIKSHKGINAPTASISAAPLTPKDRRDLHFGITHGVDYVALSFVKEAKNIFELRRILKQAKSHAKIIAKIERHEAIANIEEIIKAADAVMVARGDLGVEIAAEQVPLHQKKIIHLSNLHGKPVIVATQMLNSMVENPRATRAEISDAATAIFDHADAFMLSNETAVGKYPVEATRTLQKVASAVEKDLKVHQNLLTLHRPEDVRLTNATCRNACTLADDINAKFIVAITRSGYTAREIAKYRPFIPIIVFTPDIHVARQQSLVWGVTNSFVQFIHLAHPLTQIRKTLIAHKLVKEGDEIVVCNAGFGKREKLITTTMI